jgi:hypothetical protein
MNLTAGKKTIKETDAKQNNTNTPLPPHRRGFKNCFTQNISGTPVTSILSFFLSFFLFFFQFR